MIGETTETPKMREIGTSRLMEMKYIKISGIPLDKRLDVLLTGILEVEVACEAGPMPQTMSK